MARPWRIQFPDAVYHVTVRGNNRQTIFTDDSDKEFFLRLLARASSRFHFKIFAFCLMGNHFHIFAQTPEGNLSSIMQWLNGTYTGYFNWRHGRSGHLLQGRYKSVLVVDDAHWLHLSCYIHLNPVRAGMVARPEQYPWSSFQDYVGMRARFSWLAFDDILAEYDANKARSRNRYRRECLGLIGQKPTFLQQAESSLIIGPKEKLKELVEKYRPRGKIETVTDYARARARKTDVQQELKRVASAFGVSYQDLWSRRKNNLARQAAYYHLVENCRLSVTKSAESMGAKMTAVTMGIKRLKAKLELPENKYLRTKIRRLNPTKCEM